MCVFSCYDDFDQLLRRGDPTLGDPPLELETEGILVLSDDGGTSPEPGSFRFETLEASPEGLEAGSVSSVVAEGGGVEIPEWFFWNETTGSESESGNSGFPRVVGSEDVENPEGIFFNQPGSGLDGIPEPGTNSPTTVDIPEWLSQIEVESEWDGIPGPSNIESLSVAGSADNKFEPQNVAATAFRDNIEEQTAFETWSCDPTTSNRSPVEYIFINQADIPDGISEDLNNNWSPSLTESVEDSVGDIDEELEIEIIQEPNVAATGFRNVIDAMVEEATAFDIWSWDRTTSNWSPLEYIDEVDIPMGMPDDLNNIGHSESPNVAEDASRADDDVGNLPQLENRNLYEREVHVHEEERADLVEDTPAPNENLELTEPPTDIDNIDDSTSNEEDRADLIDDTPAPNEVLQPSNINQVGSPDVAVGTSRNEFDDFVFVSDTSSNGAVCDVPIEHSHEADTRCASPVLSDYVRVSVDEYHRSLEEMYLGVMDTTDQPNSLCHVSPIQMLYQPPQPPTHQQPVHLPFAKLDGEGVQYNGKTADGQITVTSYRVYIQIGEVHHLIPLGLIENVEHRELFYLHIGCKDARTFRCTFLNNETCMDWFEKLTKFIEPRRCLEQNFAFYNYAWVKHRGGQEFEEKSRNARLFTYDQLTFKQEMERLQFGGDSWRVCDANKDYKLCPSYPPFLMVPSSINDMILEAVAKFRSSRRIPAVVWRHVKNGAVIARSSQPEVGWLGWRSSEDEELLKAISEACCFSDKQDEQQDQESLLSHSPGSASLHSDDSLQITPDIKGKEKKVLILDARSYTTAVANRARGGGCECQEYYPNCDIMFMNLANIHSIRKSFQALRLLCTGPKDHPNWHSQLEGTRWMQHMSVLMKAANTLVKAVEREARPVLVHCSDGWDRTPQIVALAELMLDPYYRTIDGFRILIEREWLAFGHKFADRCGHAPNGDTNERCPVFLQWLDCVHQMLDQFQCAFEFSQSYLVKLAHHVYSNLYGTFLCNTYQERMNVVNEKTFTVWDFLNDHRFKNHLYASPGNTGGLKVLWPQYNIRDLRFWQEMYLGSLEANHDTSSSSGSCPGPPESSPSHMTKTRSYGDLINAADSVGPSQIRRSSDPSINIDKKLVISQESTSTTQDIVEQPHSSSQNGNFLCTDPDEVECNRDCIYKNVNGGLHNGNLTFNLPRVDSASVNGTTDGFFRDNVINGEKTDDESDSVDEVREVLRNACLNDDLTPSYNHSNEVDSDNELTERSESRSENTVCDVGAAERLETSTDTLVSDSHNFSSSPLEVHGFEKLQTPIENGDTTDGYKLCAQNLKLVNAVCNGRPGISKECISPAYSRASSSSGWDTGLPHHKQWHQTHPFNLGEDGLVPVTSVAQERLWQIIQEQRRKEELLEKELHTYRQALLKQSCHRCNNNDSEKIDDTGSVVESICSAGEGQASAVESLRSDMSWEAVEDNCILAECTATLWVPDHAVSRCTGCQTEFWVGKRKHHCRKCGRIFCASCSENSTPLPSEQLYNPVRVCTACYSKLRRDCGELPDQCKHSNGQPPNSNPQITASSN